eukprot:COSAG05_NODE_41_length_26845_cov_26.599230_15_plen_216_part_00
MCFVFCVLCVCVCVFFFVFSVDTERFLAVKVYTPEVQSYLDNVCKQTPNNIFIISQRQVERVAVAQVEISLSTVANIAGCEGRLPTPPAISPLQASFLGWGLHRHALDVALLIGCVRVDWRKSLQNSLFLPGPVASLDKDVCVGLLVPLPLLTRALPCFVCAGTGGRRRWWHPAGWVLRGQGVPAALRRGFCGGIRGLGRSGARQAPPRVLGAGW